MMAEESRMTGVRNTIQINTFTKWLNEQLMESGFYISDLSKDLSDGILLIRIVERLQKAKCLGKMYTNNPSEIQRIMNVQLALDALKGDGVRLTNIGAHDIADGNLKLILGLIWCLIQRYHIDSPTKLPAKKLILYWLQSVLPELNISNFHKNWNDGRSLCALLDYCKPGLFTDWRNLDQRNAAKNCENAFLVAESEFGIPRILSSTDMSSPDLDELSCVTYLSYFVKVGGPGYSATLRHVRKLMPDYRINDFEKSWKDGYLLCALVRTLGGDVDDVQRGTSYGHSLNNMQKALKGAVKLGVYSTVNAEELADPMSGHLGIMGLVAALCSITMPYTKRATHCYQGQQVNLHLAFATGTDVQLDDLEVTVTGPRKQLISQNVQKRKLQDEKHKGAVISFIPIETGLHSIRIHCQGIELPSSPIVLQVLASPETVSSPTNTNEMDYYPPPDVGHVSFSGLSEPCSIGSIVEVVINAHGESSTGNVLVEAGSPSGRVKRCQVIKKGSVFTATFTPNEVGEWQIGILYEGEHIRGSPFSCKVFDANLVQVYGLDVGLVGQELKFSVNASQAGDGFVKVSVLRHGRSMPCEVIEQGSSGVYRVTFTPDGAGQYKIHVLFNNMEVKGSPFTLDIADASSVSVFGDNLRMASVDRLSTFMIHAAGAQCKDITVTITAPSGKTKQARVYQIDDLTYKVEWKAVEAGEHSIDVQLFNQSVYESPFVCNVGDPDLVTVRNMPESINADQLFRDYTFEIDASAAGSGNLEIMINGGHVACRVRELGGRHYLASFTPTQAITHTIEMRFNGESVRLSPWRIPIRGSPVNPNNSSYELEQRTTRSIESRRIERNESWYTELSGVGLQRAAVGKPTTFQISGEGIDENDINARIYGPDGADVPIKIYRKGEKLICEYRINQVGEHSLEMSICGKKIDPYPLNISGYSTENVKIEPLAGGAPGQPVQFIVDAVNAGKGQLEISVNQGKVPNNVQMQGAGRCLVTFIPQYPGTYVIDVTFNGEQVEGCPIRVDILPKQVGQTVSAPIVSQQTTTAAAITTTTSTMMHRSTAYRQVEERSLSPAKPIATVQAPRDRSPLPEHPKTPEQSKKADSKYTDGKFSPRWDSSSQQSTSPMPWKSSLTRATSNSPSGGSERSRKIDDYDPIAREKEREVEPPKSPTDKKDERIGYTVAQYGSGLGPQPGQTVSSRTFSDDGHGTFTSTYTSETRYGNISPKRIYEYAKGTSRKPAAEVTSTATPTAYSETRTYNLPKPSEPKTSPYSTRKQPSQKDLPASVMDQTDRSRRFDAIDTKSFVTDSRSYGFAPTTKESGQKEGGTPLRYFGEETGDKRLQKESPIRGDGGAYTTTYDRYREGQRKSMTSDKGSSEEITSGRTGYIGYSTESYYSRSTFEPGSVRFTERLGHDAEMPETKRPSLEAAVIASYDRAKSDVTSDRYRGGPSEPPTTVLERYNELEYLPKSWRSAELSEKGDSYRREDDLSKRPYFGGDHRYVSEGSRYATGGEDSRYRSNGSRDDGNRIIEITSFSSHGKDKSYVASEISFRPEYESKFQKQRSYDHEPDAPLQTLKRARDMEPAYLGEAAQRTADFMHTYVGGREVLGTVTHTVSHTDSAYGQSEPEGVISSDVVEEALSPQIQDDSSSRTRRKIYEKNIRHEEELDESQKEMRDGLPTIRPAEELEQTKATSSSTTPKSTPRTTPKLSFKFGKDSKEREGDKVGFNFGKSKISSKHEIVRRGKDVEVKVDSLKLSKDDKLRVTVGLPTRGNAEYKEIEPKVKKSRHTYEISFRPTEVGTHKVMVYVNDVLHPMCPFPIRSYDVSEIIVGEITPQSTINDTVEFTVDAGRAGFGNLEMAIKDSDGVIIPSHVAQLEPGTAKFLVTFNPTSLGMHTVNITFNKEVLKNSPFEVNIVEAMPNGPVETMSTESKKKDGKKEKEEKKREEKERAKKEKEEKLMAENLKKMKEKEAKKRGKNVTEKKPSVTKVPSLSRVGRPAQILVTAPDSDVTVTVKDPARNWVSNTVSEQELGVISIEFTPEQVGDHEVEIKHGGNDVQGSPLTVRAYDPAKISVGNIPNSVVDKPVHFVVDASEAGVGNLEVAVNEGRIPSMASALGQHRYDISFVPRELADHTITVRFNNEPVPGSPFTCHLVTAQSVTIAGPGLERIPVDKLAEFYVNVEGIKDASPKVHITDSQGANIPVTITKSDSESGKYVVSYIPKAVGNHQIDVSCEDQAVSGSPFTSKAFDARCARLSCVEEAIVGCPCTFTIDAARAGAGNMEIIVSVENRNVPNFVQAEGQAKFKVSFTPQEAKEHLVSVRFNGEPIPGSPMVCPVREKPSQQDTTATVTPTMTSSSLNQSGEIRLVGDLTVGQVGQTKGFSIDTGGRETDCNVIVTDSEGRELDVQVERVCNGYHLQFMPLTAGEHEIEIILDGRQLGIGPFAMEVHEPPKIARLPSTILAGKELVFELDTGGVPRGEVRLEVKDADGRVLPARTEVDSDGVIRAYCKFRNSGQYSVDVFINNKQYGERQYVRVVEAGHGAEVLSNLEQILVGHPSKLILRADPDAGKHLTVTVTDSERTPVPVSLQKLPDEIFEAVFTPRNEGTHIVSVLVGDEHVKGSPFTVSVLDLSAVRVIGLKNDQLGVEQRFNVDHSNSGGKGVAVRVTRGSKEVPCTLKRVKPGLHVCSFTPRQVGLHLIDVMLDGIALPECPYECIVNDLGAVRARGDALTRAQRGKTARFEVSMADEARGDLDVLISDARGGPLPVRCYKQHDDSYWVEFTPENIGLHSIEVTFAESPIAGSPFKCEVVDPRKVYVKGLNETFVVRQPAVFTINRELAGNGELTVELLDPTDEPVKYEMRRTSDGDDLIEFIPTSTGQYRLITKLSGFLVNGTPHIITVEEQGKPTVTSAALECPVEIGRPISIIVNAKSMKSGLKIDIKGPKKSKVRHAANRNADGTTEVIFTPTEVGLYLISIEQNNRPIPGSPFEVEVVDPRSVIVNDETADDDGFYHFAVQQRNIFDVDATAAGSGKLRAEVRDWDGKTVSGCDVESLGYGKYRVLFSPQYPGKYSIYLYWADLPVQGAYPLHILAEGEQPSTSRAVPLTNTIETRSSRLRSDERSLRDDESGDHMRIYLRGEGLTRANNKEQAEFIIDGSEASRDGQVSCSLIGQKADIPVRLTHLGNNVYKAVYTPLIPGSYELQILWDGRQVHGSPYRIDVGTHVSPAQMIGIDSNALKMGIINEELKAVIDARQAASNGSITAQCMGPTKLAYCELYDQRDGTIVLTVRPSEIGKHTLVVKYSDEHVPGSPFTFNVSYPPDASKVRVFGPGIEHGILSTFKSNFVVETKGAGAGQLTVRVRGPKGAFNVEMQREKKQERTIHCKYEPKEPGDYQVEVKWHGEHVPGSPFLVMIVDTEQELQRFLRGDAPSPQPATPFIPPGWIGTPPPPPLFLGGPPPRGPPFVSHPALPPPPHGPLVPFVAPPPPHAMRSALRPRFTNGY